MLTYDLPKELIAQRPCEPRDAARLLVVRREQGTVPLRDCPLFFPDNQQAGGIARLAGFLRDQLFGKMVGEHETIITGAELHELEVLLTTN